MSCALQHTSRTTGLSQSLSMAGPEPATSRYSLVLYYLVKYLYSIIWIPTQLPQVLCRILGSQFYRGTIWSTIR